MRRRKTTQIILILILSSFLFTNPMLGGLLLYGSDVHYGSHNVHIHDRGIGEDGPRDVNIKLYHEYLATIDSYAKKDCLVDLPYLYTDIYSEHYNNNIFGPFQRTISCLGLGRYCKYNLFLINSSYLI